MTAPTDAEETPEDRVRRLLGNATDGVVQARVRTLRGLLDALDAARADRARLLGVLRRVYDAELEDARERWDAEQAMASALELRDE